MDGRAGSVLPLVLLAAGTVGCTRSETTANPTAGPAGVAGGATGTGTGGQRPSTGGVAGQAPAPAGQGDARGGGVAGTGGVEAGGAAGAAPGNPGLPAGTDAGSGPDAGPPAPANPDCPAGALFCDDFESYPLGASLAPNWTTQLVNGQVQVETSRPYRGAKSVRLTTTLSAANEPARTNGGPLRAATLTKEGAPLFPLPSNAFFGRAMIWLTQMPPGGVHFSNVEALGRLPDGTLAKYGEGGMYDKLLAGYTIRPMTELDQPTVDCSKSATTGLPEGRWVCLEWQFDGGHDEMHEWLDGVLQTGVDVVEQAGGCSVAWKAPTFDKLYLGWRHAQPSSIDTEMWMDDVVLHTARVGCPGPP